MGKEICSQKLYTKNFYDSPSTGFNSFNVNARRNYTTLCNNKYKIDELQIDP
jgi:hypothetical protein